MEKRKPMIMNDELKPIMDKVEILVEEIQNKKYTYEEARAKCHEIYDMVPAEYLVNFVSLNNAMDAAYPGVLDHSFKRIYKIPIGNIPDEEIDSYIQRVVAKFKK